LFKFDYDIVGLFAKRAECENVTRDIHEKWLCVRGYSATQKYVNVSHILVGFTKAMCSNSVDTERADK